MMRTTPFFPRLLLAAACFCAVPFVRADPAPAPGWTAVANDEWKAADQDDTQVAKGSALDLSPLFPSPGEAGRDGFATINPAGELVFSRKPDETARFRCASGLPVPNSLPLGKLYEPAELDRLADQLVRGGYNMVRPHWLDTVLMAGSREDGVFNPERLDRWDYYAAALKKRGIYLYIDAMSAPAAYYAVSDPWSRESSALNLATRLYYDEAARAHWKEGVRRFFEHVNPYTGMALKDEPQVAVVQLRNEAGLNFRMYLPHSVTPEITDAFRVWLRKRYGTTEALKAAWTRREGATTACSLRDGQTLDTVEWPPFQGKGPDSQDLQRFFLETERETTLWMIRTIREIGVRVPLIDYNNGYSAESSLARDVLPMADIHAYHDHPTNYLSPGSAETGKSSLADGVEMFRVMAGTRQMGRPFFCSEWGQVFWNPFRHEAGLTVPAYAALQGWQMIAQFADPVKPVSDHEPIRPFSLHDDPPLKAAEYMSALLYRRGDVRPSPHAVEVALSPDLFQGTYSMQDGLLSAITRLALLAGLGVRVSGLPDAAPRAPTRADLVFSPHGGQQVTTREGVQEVVEAATPDAALAGTVAKLREKGILPPGNKTDAAAGLFESDTSQIILDQRRCQIRVSTDRSQGASLSPDAPAADLGAFSVTNAGAPATVFVGSLTAQAIPDSDRLLVIVATDALNSGMGFEDESRRKLVSLGNWPVLLQVARVQLTLRHRHPERLKMWALGANGARRDEIPLAVQAGGETAAARIDTGALQNGPTPYFEVEEQP